VARKCNEGMERHFSLVMVLWSHHKWHSDGFLVNPFRRLDVWKEFGAQGRIMRGKVAAVQDSGSADGDEEERPSRATYHLDHLSSIVVSENRLSANEIEQFT
jgi:hypothetical protein